MAEAGATDKQAIKNVVHVILNRVESNRFPNTVRGVVFQKNQFSTTFSGGRYHTVKVTDFVRKAVDEACSETDTTRGALIFCARWCGVISSWKQKYQLLFVDDVGHHFFKFR